MEYFSRREGVKEISSKYITSCIAYGMTCCMGSRISPSNHCYYKKIFVLRAKIILRHVAYAPVFQMAVNAIHRINLYPMDSAIGSPNTYPLDSGLSGG